MKIEKGAATLRPRQETPAAMVERLLNLVRGQFCGSMSAEEWGKNKHFVKRKVITWPASFITGKGFTLSAERYEAVMREVFTEIKRNCAQDEVQYWPAYLTKCVQEYWQHHWEEHYSRAKSARNIAETALMQLGRLGEREDATVQTLAEVHAVLAAKSKHKRLAPRPAKQGELEL